MLAKISKRLFANPKQDKGKMPSVAAMEAQGYELG
jgi:hypothetical protein